MSIPQYIPHNRCRASHHIEKTVYILCREIVDFQEVIKLILFKTILGLYLTQSDVDKYYSGYSTENITNPNTYLNTFSLWKELQAILSHFRYMFCYYMMELSITIYSLEKDINFPRLYRNLKSICFYCKCIHILSAWMYVFVWMCVYKYMKIYKTEHEFWKMKRFKNNGKLINTSNYVWQLYSCENYKQNMI